MVGHGAGAISSNYKLVDCTVYMERQLAEGREGFADDTKDDPVAEALVHVVSLRALTHLLGPVGGRKVLDMACGDGSLSRRLAIHGAEVTGVDSSVEYIELAKEMESREPRGISYLACEAEDLYDIDDAFFDDVVCNLSLGRMENVGAVVAEVSRIIKLGGRFIFSVVHPCFEQQLLETRRNGAGADNYFSEGMRDGLLGAVRHRTLSTYINAVAARGFTVRRLLEPAAAEKDIVNKPGFEDWRKLPVALVIEAVFPLI